MGAISPSLSQPPLLPYETLIIIIASNYLHYGNDHNQNELLFLVFDLIDLYDVYMNIHYHNVDYTLNYYSKLCIISRNEVCFIV